MTCQNAPADQAIRPGTVVGIDGVVFQCDADDPISALLIRPIQRLSRKLCGGSWTSDASRPLANHAGLRLQIVGADGRRGTYVAENLNGTLRQNFVNGLSWTRWAAFQRRSRGGWDALVPATAFRGIEAADVAAAVQALNRADGNPFVGEICTQFIERMFGGKRMFDQVELLEQLVSGLRLPAPAAPIFKPDAKLSRRARHLLHADELATLHRDVEREKPATPDRPADASALSQDRALGRLATGRPSLGGTWYWLCNELEHLSAWFTR